MITEEVKKEIEELVREGEKLIDALRREGNNSKDLVLFLCTYERWYTRSLRHIKTIIPERVNDFVLLYRDDSRKEITSSNYLLSDAMRIERYSMGVYGPWSAVLCLVRQRQMLLACLDLMNSKMR